MTVHTSDGKVYSWGGDSSGYALGNGTSYSSAPIAVTMTGALAGKTVTQLVPLYVASSSGPAYGGALALTSDGALYGWGSFNVPNGLGDSSNHPLPVAVTGALAGKTVTQVATAGGAAFALTSDGKVYSWGGDSSGYALGNGTSYSSAPIAVTMTSALAGKTVGGSTPGTGGTGSAPTFVGYKEECRSFAR